MGRSPSALAQLMCSTLAAELKSQRNHKRGRCMNKRLIWVEGDDFSGWCCPDCSWGMTAPRLESTVAALAFNRLAQETFEKHKCAANTCTNSPC